MLSGTFLAYYSEILILLPLLLTIAFIQQLFFISRIVFTHCRYLTSNVLL